MFFKKISIIDQCGLNETTINEISKFATKIEKYNDDPSSQLEIIERINDADCILVSWRTRLTSHILSSCPSLKYVGLCYSLYNENESNIDIIHAKNLGITVKGVNAYGDEGTVEFIFAQLITLLQGLGAHQWKDEPEELKGKNFGIIGLGRVGKIVANTALHFGMNVFYFSRNRNIEIENKGVNYLPISELLSTCDIISTHVPRNNVLLQQNEFELMKDISIFVNTSVGLTFEKTAFLKWITNNKKSFAIFDACGSGDHSEEFSKYNNIILSNKFSGFTSEARERLSNQVLQNIKNFLNL